MLEELPEQEQLRLIEGLDLDRVVDVLDEMEYDDLADLLHEMPVHQRKAYRLPQGGEDRRPPRQTVIHDLPP